MTHCTTTITPLLISRRLQSGVRFVGKCYAPHQPRAEGLTLLFFHSAGSHKEVFEPIIAYLLPLEDPTTRLPIIREAWTFDMQSHGEAAVLNGETLKSIEISVEDWADGLKAFIASGTLDGHKLVPIGHSLGATAVLLATIPDGPLPPVAFEYIVLVEPALVTREGWKENLDEREEELKMTSEAVMKRRAVWSSREEAQQYFKKRFPWAFWDTRVLELYVRHGLREAPSENGMTQVVLACPKTQENAAYTYIEPQFIVVDWLKTFDRSIPIHFVLGSRMDLIPESCHNSVMELRPVASVQKVPDAGHFVVQENPDGLAFAIARVLTSAAFPRAAL